TAAPPPTTLSPYPTLFRSGQQRQLLVRGGRLPARASEPSGPERAAVLLHDAVTARQPGRAQVPAPVRRADAGVDAAARARALLRSEEHTSELQSREKHVCR